MCVGCTWEGEVHGVAVFRRESIVIVKGGTVFFGRGGEGRRGRRRK